MTEQQHSRAAVRVCTIAGIECSRNCGTGSCKRETPTVEQHEAAPTYFKSGTVDPEVVDALIRDLPTAPSAPLEDTGNGADERALFEAAYCGAVPRSQMDLRRRADGTYVHDVQNTAWRIWQKARAPRTEVAGAVWKRDDTGRITSDYEPSPLEIKVARDAICRKFGNNGTDGYYIRILKAIHAAQQCSADAAAVPAMAKREDWQQKALDHGFTYWRAPDAHGVECTAQQAIDLLQDLLGVEVEIKDATQQPEPRAEVTDEQIADTFERVTGYSIENGRAALNDADILGFARELLEAARAGEGQ